MRRYLFPFLVGAGGALLIVVLALLALLAWHLYADHAIWHDLLRQLQTPPPQAAIAEPPASE